MHKILIPDLRGLISDHPAGKRRRILRANLSLKLVEYWDDIRKRRGARQALDKIYAEIYHLGDIVEGELNIVHDSVNVNM